MEALSNLADFPGDAGGGDLNLETDAMASLDGVFGGINIAFLIAVLVSGRGGAILTHHLRIGKKTPRPHPDENNAGEALAFNTVRALVYAVRASGTLDIRKRQSIELEVRKLEPSREALLFVDQCLSENINPGRIAQNIASFDKESEAFWLYAFSYSVIHAAPVSSMECEYLDRLAASLGISDTVKEEIERKASRLRERKKELN